MNLNIEIGKGKIYRKTESDFIFYLHAFDVEIAFYLNPVLPMSFQVEPRYSRSDRDTIIDYSFSLTVGDTTKTYHYDVLQESILARDINALENKLEKIGRMSHAHS